MHRFHTIDTIAIDDDTFGDENKGMVLVSVFDSKGVKVLVTKTEGADADLFLSRDQVHQLIDALKKSLTHLP